MGSFSTGTNSAQGKSQPLTGGGCHMGPPREADVTWAPHGRFPHFWCFADSQFWRIWAHPHSLSMCGRRGRGRGGVGGGSRGLGPQVSLLQGRPSIWRPATARADCRWPGGTKFPASLRRPFFHFDLLQHTYTHTCWLLLSPPPPPSLSLFPFVAEPVEPDFETGRHCGRAQRHVSRL